MLRERSSAPPLPPSRRAQALVGRDTAPPLATTRWQSQAQANRRFRPLADEEANRLLGIRADDDDDDYNRDSDLEDWRQNAQMLSERDEMLLLAGGRGDALDVAPVNRRKLIDTSRRRSPQTPTTIETTSSRQSPEVDQQTKARRTIFSLAKRGQGSKQAREKSRTKAKSRHKFGQLLDEDDADEGDNNDRDEDEQFNVNQAGDQDDNSSISFAQSGCHSILSAWRLKAAKRRARQSVSTKGANANMTRPRSVLSNSSSVGKKSSASTAYTLGSRLGPPTASNRIPLGPKSAQHFVTNSRRRRRANELILSTLEARRRAISLNRQSILAAGSLFGSESYLGAAGMPLDDYQRLSLTPSPGARLRRSPDDDVGQSAAVAELTRRTALSDLGGGGGRQSPAVEAQRSKLLLMSTARTAATSDKQPPIQSPRLGEKGAQRQPPPLAKLDQNSSDLCSSNESSSGAESKAESSSSSSGSQFTQLVTSELTPSRMLMGDLHDDELELGRDYRLGRFSSVSASVHARGPQVRTSNPKSRPTSQEAVQQKQQHQVSSTTERRPPQQVVVERISFDNKENLRQSQQVSERQRQVSTTASEDDDKLGKLRRGALKRDSIRRLRLNQKQQREKQAADGSSSSNDYEHQQVSRSRPGSSRLASGRDQKQKSADEQQQHRRQQILRPLSKARKLDIESNPFLNRHHFRTMSARSTESRQSYAGSQRSRASPVCPPRQTSVDQPSGERVRSSRLESSSPLSPKPTPPDKSQEGPSRFESVPVDSSRLQMPQIDLDNLRQAEQLIRELQGTRSPPVITRRNVDRLKQERQAKSLSLEVQPAALAPAAPPRRRTREQPPQPHQHHDEPMSERNVFKTTTRLVCEGASSSDNFRSDLKGSSQQVELLEKWRHEQQPPVRRPDGSTFSEQKFSSERIEIRRSRERLDGSRPHSISPPAEFSDNPDSRTLSRQQPVDPQHRSSNKLMRASTQPQSDQRASLRPRQATSIDETSAKSVPPARQSSFPARPKASSMMAQTESKPGKPLESLAAHLPKFERTADDEFKKRVDRLRQMARTNLEASEARQRQEAATARRRELVRPLSTNWDGPREDDQEVAANQQQSGTTSKRLSQSSLKPAPASTNLDEMLLADRYQRPLSSARSAAPVGTWRRSNSSLASLGSNIRASPASAAARRPTSPNPAASLLSHSTASASDSQTASSQIGAPMRVVVRERSAPQLDFAQVEQRPVAQRFVERASSSSRQQPPAAGASLRSAAEPKSQQRKQFSAGEIRTRQQIGTSVTEYQMETQTKTSSTIGGSQQPTRSQPATTTTTSSIAKAAQQRASPRSPEFGRAATSSNDDSAIASSVSSPSSFSFAMSSGGQSKMQQAGSSEAPSSNVESTQLRVPSGESAPLPAAGAAPLQSQSIQSILRRHQAGSSFPSANFLSSNMLPTHHDHHHSNVLFTQPQAFNSAPPTPMQHNFTDDRAQISSPPPAQLVGLASTSVAELQQNTSAAPIKRVHFNDRTSVRSFESISSTNSNTTAIAQHQQSDLDDFGARQQVGSPDSMGSGSTSRLSCESPAFGESRRPGGAAAIYAVRGDPDLELAGGGQTSAFGLQARVPPAPPADQAHPLRIGQTLFGSQPAPQQQQQPLSGGQLQPLLQTGSQIRNQFAPQVPHVQHQVPVPGAIRMTAPPAMSRGPNSLTPRGQHILVQQQQVLPIPVQVNNQQQQQQFRQQQHQFAAGQLGVSRVLPPATVVVDEEDPDYALRLRQAATRRAFNFNQPSPQHAQQVGPDGRKQNSETRSRQNAANLANFHTEV